LPLEMGTKENNQFYACVDLPMQPLEFSLFSAKEISSGLGIPMQKMDISKPIMYDKTTSSLFVPFSSLEALKNVIVDPTGSKKFSKEKGIASFCLLTPFSIDFKNLAHIRCFSPNEKEKEETIGGPTLAGVGTYLFKNNIITHPSSEITVEEGHFIGKPCSFKMKIYQSLDQIKLKLHFDNFNSNSIKLRI
jgi:PhzF family phenazine biosynthesis protein